MLRPKIAGNWPKYDPTETCSLWTRFLHCRVELPTMSLRRRTHSPAAMEHHGNARYVVWSDSGQLIAASAHRCSSLSITLKRLPLSQKAQKASEPVLTSLLTGDLEQNQRLELRHSPCRPSCFWWASFSRCQNPEKLIPRWKNVSATRKCEKITLSSN